MSIYRDFLENEYPKDSMVLLPAGHAFATWPAHLTILGDEIRELIERHHRTISERLDNNQE